MAVGVDEAGGEIAPRGLDDPRTLGRQLRPQSGDAPLGDPDVGAEPGRAGAVDDAGVADDGRSGQINL